MNTVVEIQQKKEGCVSVLPFNVNTLAIQCVFYIVLGSVCVFLAGYGT